MIDTTPAPISSIAKSYNVHPGKLTRYYKDFLSDFHDWAKTTDTNALVFPQNFGARMSIDETCLSDGELYTILTNKDAKGRKGCLAAIIKGTKQQTITKALGKVPVTQRFAVREITLDMADTMDWITRVNFPNAVAVVDRFHVQKEVMDAVQEIRIRHRHAAIANDNAAVMTAKKERGTYTPKRYANGDTQKELLARSRYLLFQTPNRWRESQQVRAAILFREFPDIETAYKLALEFRGLYETRDTPERMRTKFKQWYEKVSRSELKELCAAACTVERHEGRILNYFKNRATNASAESFNAKLKGFRSLLRGVSDTKFSVPCNQAVCLILESPTRLNVIRFPFCH